jgi:hypothetical protein
MPSDSPNHVRGSCMSPFPSAFTFIPCIHFPPASPQGSRSPSPSGRDVLTLRALVSTKDAGVIIGKGGKNVADLREQTGVKAGVSKNLPGIHERVLSISGSVESVAKVCSRNLSRYYMLPDSFSKGIFAHYCSARGCKPLFSHHLLHHRGPHFYAPLNLTQPHGHHHRPFRCKN